MSPKAPAKDGLDRSQVDTACTTVWLMDAWLRLAAWLHCCVTGDRESHDCVAYDQEKKHGCMADVQQLHSCWYECIEKNGHPMKLQQVHISG